ncbi:CACTA en-spm transposon protein [Cucumis melo var. makuwa]|uniref:CACTA en-spm transposon protein n=1 Tax=Cucumis melo var. makuwa TaxID=1194695 RepID=A0A5D3CT48_CUCMM|nr:CACTA en-spm transposon protein [Cucumis melo var. makuwa]TYK14388.1 CACTA en-spm transposon protein [Cucumis melo var. makuwa]
METDAMFLELEDDLDNIAEGSWVTIRSSSQQSATPTLRRRAQSRLLKLERHVAINGRILMTIAPGAEKPISPHAIRFSQAIGMCRLFVLDFNDQAMNRSNHERTRLLDRSSLTIIVGGPSRFYNDSTSLLREKGSRSIVWSCSEKHIFVLQDAEDAHNQMLKLQSQPTPEGSQPLSEDKICDQVLGRRPGYSKGLGWGPKPKARRTTSASSSSTSYS